MRALLFLVAVGALALEACAEGTTNHRSTDAASMNDASEGVHLDAGFPSRDARTTDAASQDTGVFEDAAQASDAAAADAPARDTGSGDASAPDARADAGMPGADAGFSDAGVFMESGQVIVSEILSVPPSGSLEWIELYNTLASAVTITGGMVAVDSHAGLGPQPIHAASDPTGAQGTGVTLAPHAFAYGVPNPMNASSIPAGAAFVFGAPGAFGSNALADSGDAVTLYLSTGSILDRVDFRRIYGSPSGTPALDDFPLLAGSSISLDPASLTASANNSGTNWCVQIFRGPTPGRMNDDCRGFLISEVTYAWASLSGPSDPRHQFVELAGAAGGAFANVAVTRVDGASRQATDIAVTGTRMPMSGLYVIADDGGTGSTLVAGANQIATLAFGHGPDAIQIVRTDPGQSAVLLDALGYGALSENTDAQRMLPIYEGTPLPAPDAVAHPVNWARSDGEIDTRNNRADFRFAPTATPGARNGTGSFAVTSITPDNAIATLTATVVIRGVELTDRMSVHVGSSTASACRFVEDEALSCTIPYPAGGSGAAQRADVRVSTRPEDGASAAIAMGFTWTTADNGMSTPATCDYCVLQFPATLSVQAGQASMPVYGRIFQAGLTDVSVGPAPGITVELGYGPAGSNPLASNAWRWLPTTFNVKTGPMGHNDEYQGTLSIATSGTYSYTYRFSLDGGLTWTYADLAGAGKNPGLTPFSASNLGTATVN